MLTDDDVIADLARLRERTADIEYAGAVPLTRRSAAAAVAPVAALAAVVTGGAAVVAGSHGDGRGPAADPGPSISAGESVASPGLDATTAPQVELVAARITLAGRTIVYRHPVGEDPFASGWQLAVEYGQTLPGDATKFVLADGSVVWVADAQASAQGGSVLIVRSGPDGNTGERQFVGMPSDFTRAALEAWVRTELAGQ